MRTRRRYRHCCQKNTALQSTSERPHLTIKKDACGNTKRKAQTKLRDMQDLWYIKKANEIQGYADSHDTKRFYDALKTVCGQQSSGSSPLLTAYGTQLLTEKKQILEVG